MHPKVETYQISCSLFPSNHFSNIYNLIRFPYTAKDNDQLATIHLLQLILGCAVNCENKEKYIGAIMGMEESVQQSLMEAIQQVCLFFPSI